MHTAAPLRSVDSTTTATTRQLGPAGLAVLAGGGLLLVLTHESLARLLADLLPGRALVTSAGETRSWGGWTERGGSIIAALGLSVVVSSVLAAIHARRPALGVAVLERRLDRFRLWAGLLSVAISAWFWWVSTPFNAAHPHVYYHWTLQVFSDDATHHYFLPQFFHRFVQGVPSFFQGLNWGVVALLNLFLAGRILGRTPLALMAGAGVAFSGNLLYFAAGEEDLSINIVAYALFALALMTRRAPLIAASMLVVVMGRTTGVVVPVALLVGAGAAAFVADRDRLAPLRLATRSVAWFVLYFVCYQIFLHFESRRWFLIDGSIVNYAGVAAQEPRPVQGFTIYPFSGAYVGHSLWTFPLAFTLVTIVGIVFIRRMEPTYRFPLLVLAAASAALILLNEVEVAMFYNVRYLSYGLPFLWYASWVVLGGLFLRRDGPIGVATVFVAAMVMLAPATVPFDALAARQDRSELPTAGLIPATDELRAMVGDGCVAVAGDISGGQPAKGLRQAVNFVLQRPSVPGTLEPDTQFADCHLFALRSDLETIDVTVKRDLVWSDDGVVLVGPTHGS